MKKTYILDTSVLLHDPEAIYNFEENDLIIPYAVLEELENKKRQLDDVGRLARQTIRILDNLREKGKLAKGVSLPEGGKLKIEINHCSGESLPLLSDPSLPDNRILAVTLNLSKETKKPVILVTKDIAMRVKADALNLRTQDYYNDKVSLKPENSDLSRITIEDLELSKLYQKKMILLPTPVLPNSCLHAVLTDESEIPLLASADGESAILANPHDQISWGITPKNTEQTWALALLNNPQVKLVSLMGPAGTGKTLLTLAAALEQTVHQERYTRIICARPIIPFGKDIGFLPGEKEQKVRPYMQPFYDNLEFLMTPKDKMQEKNIESYIDSAIELLKKKNLLEIEVLTYIRGRSIPNQFFIIDEAQNLSAHEIKTIITRAGEDTKIVLCGDPDQIDHPYLDKQSNGLAYVASRLKGQPFYGQVYLTKGERSELATRASLLL
ncbi:PhoH family protein [Dehalobacter sp. DCM]|uniref:PhoH family protein n=1 Tax=Dehalobacter sp. DCM TaxID=2907827 RepID=UPI0030821AD4|nr:PhoH family protein [Dehalobacter sp. DCM]